MILKGKEETDQIINALDNMAEELDVKLNDVLKRQEQDYLKGYSIYVREKERELRELIVKINEKDQNYKLKDEIIYQLKNNIKMNYEHAQKQANLSKEQTDKIKALHAKCEIIQKDRNFIQTHLVESKRQNKLL